MKLQDVLLNVISFLGYKYDYKTEWEYGKKLKMDKQK